MGYEPKNSGKPERTEAAINPQAVAVLPVMFVYSPVGKLDAVTS